jgi:ketosteroid isomerase-like protein
MALNEAALQELIDKEAIRELVLHYSRAIDRKDLALLKDLYTEDATDTHGTDFNGTASDFVSFIEATQPFMPYSGHHVCNHLISVEGDQAFGEVYILGAQCIGAIDGDKLEDWHVMRYMDDYRRCADGKWRFAKRVVAYDWIILRPYEGAIADSGEGDQSYSELKSRLFARGPRA